LILLLSSIGISFYFTSNNHANHYHDDQSMTKTATTTYHFHNNIPKQMNAKHQDFVLDVDYQQDTHPTNIHHRNDTSMIDLGPIPEIDPPFMFQVVTTASTSTDDNDDTIVEDDMCNSTTWTSSCTSIPTHDMIQAFHKDGVVAIRGLISQQLLHQLDIESLQLIQEEQQKRLQQQQQQQQNKHKKKMNTQFYTVRHHVLFHSYTNHYNNSHRDPSVLSSFAQVALYSSIASYVASFLHLHENSNNDSNNNNNNSNNASSNHPSMTRNDDANTYVQHDNVTTNTASSTNCCLSCCYHDNQHYHHHDTPQTIKTLRVIRDIFLAKENQNEYTCGWHVDDMGFWPVTPDSSDGMNVWIALDDMPINSSSGFALAIQSHTAEWKHDAYHATGASMLYPKHGYTNVSDMFQQRTGSGTCHIQQSAPHIHQRMEDTKRIYDIQRGDVIFHTRWLFHKTIPYMTTNNNNNNNNENHSNDHHDENENHQVYRRYSIRYGSGSTTIIPPGYGTEYSVLYNPINGGKSADEICYNDNIPWYPIAWPPPFDSNHHEYQKQIQQEFHDMVQTKFPIVEKLAKERRNEMKPYLQQLAFQQQQEQKQQ
jgi:hypothetical protein